MKTPTPTPQELRDWRKKHSLTQDQAARHVQVTTRAWQRWEGGENVPYMLGFALWAYGKKI